MGRAGIRGHARHKVEPGRDCVAYAVALYHAVRQAHVPAVPHVYPHGTHSWKGRQRIAGERWTLAFLRRYL